MGKYAGAMKGAGVAAAALSIGLPFVGQLVGSIGEKMFGTTTKADQLGTSLQAIAAGGSSDGIGAFGDKLHSLGAEVEHLANPGVTQRVEDFFGSLAGQGGGEGRVSGARVGLLEAAQELRRVGGGGHGVLDERGPHRGGEGADERGLPRRGRPDD